MAPGTLPSTLDILYLADNRLTPARFEAVRKSVDIVCMGDSITGWNNHDDPTCLPTYPHFLQSLSKTQVVNCGIAGALSIDGVEQLPECRQLFPAAAVYVIGYGTNDLEWADPATASRQIMGSIETMVAALRRMHKKVVVMSVPGVDTFAFPAQQAAIYINKRDYHNDRLRRWCAIEQVPLADIEGVLGKDEYLDGVHPNEKGAQRIAAIVAKAIGQGE